MRRLKVFVQQFNEVANVALVIGVVITLNYILTLFPLRLDLTANKRFSLSPASKDIVRNIDDLVTIKVFASKKLPARFSPVYQQVKDLLWEYQNAARNKVKVQYFDPGTNAEAMQTANSLGIYPVQFSDIQSEKLEVVQGYFGLAVLYADKNETISFIQDTGNLEYQISLAIANLTRPEKPKVVFISGHEEKTLSNGLSSVSRALQKQYQMQDVDLTSGDDLPDGTSVLIIAGPQKDFSDQERYLVDQFLMQNKAVFFLIDGVKVEQGLQAVKAQSNVFNWLKSYGVSVNHNLVLDASNEIASFNTGQSSFFVSYPFWPRITSAGLSSNSVITRQLETAVFPWVSSLNVEKDKFPDGVEFTDLVKSSPRSWVQSDAYNLDPTQRFKVPDDASEKILIALIEGEIKSAFARDSLPEEVDAEGYKEQAESAKLFVAGDADFISDRFIQGDENNFYLFANMLDYAASESALSSIRAKGQTFRPLRAVSDPLKLQIKYANILGPALGLILFGVVWMYKRSKVE
ncbi:hypothetical protein B5M47_01290 [candidate division CPR3 bacterium 4484_211]|uniref:Uncharacterized protein n=1 Tax=candidate division CPR3 bacterium 4484_211 TaxID=1968527 RepID=A0A1W9NZ96_UNCC3|nr:MAG: hypothetical protein B5M47_01290 [candidate division CPR3 bacterium 4484_211]